MNLRFSSKLYTRAAVDVAVAQYEDFAKIKVAESKKAFTVSLVGMEKEHADALPGEFSNCVLMAMREAK